MAEFSNVSLTYRGANDEILVGMHLKVDRGEVLMVSGPQKCGKSLLLLSLLRESRVLSGSVYIKTGLITYCGQIPWVHDTTIRCNIVGDSAFDAAWYNDVLKACCLNNDLEKLPENDEMVAGIGGSNLSEEMQHKIVSNNKLTKQTNKTRQYSNANSCCVIVPCKSCICSARYYRG